MWVQKKISDIDANLIFAFIMLAFETILKYDRYEIRYCCL